MVKFKRIGALLVVMILMSAACQQSKVASNANQSQSNSEFAETSTAPPFSTKEPERYQATMVITAGLGEQSPAPLPPVLTTKTIFMARDGQKRRTEYEVIPGLKVTFLQLPSGRFALVPEKKIYADLAEGAQGNAAPAANTAPDFSPDKLNNESRVGARYEKLGAEDLNGRATTKYRVTLKTSANGQDVTTESMVWVDESLGMPVKTETTSTGEDVGGSKYMTELKDIKQEVDPALFVLPQDYRKVSAREIFGQTYDNPKGTGGGSSKP